MMFTFPSPLKIKLSSLLKKVV